MFLQESSLSRVYSLFNSKDILNPVAIVSAFRGENTYQKNLSLQNSLKSDVRSLGYGFIELIGHFTENKGTQEEADVTEESLCVIGNIRRETDIKVYQDTFIKNILKLGQKYDQESVIIKTTEGTSLVEANNGEVIMKFNGFSIKQLKDYLTSEVTAYSELKKKKNRLFSFYETRLREAEKVNIIKEHNINQYEGLW